MDIFDTTVDVVAQTRPDIPVTCFRPTALKKAAEWFMNDFPGKTLYAVKANPAPYILTGLYEAGIRHFDAASVAEIDLVRRLCPHAFIAFMHPVKSRKSIEQAYFDYGVRDFSFDSLEELEKIIEVTGDSKDLGLLLRLAVPNTGSEMPLSGKFGCLPDQASALLKTARHAAKRLGICFHVGSQTMDPNAYVVALAMVADILKRTPHTPIDIIDVGGGFPAIYPGMVPPDLNKYKRAIEKGLALLPQDHAMDVWCEPGRALVAESCSVLVKIELRKKDMLYINDGTYGSLFDASEQMGFRYPVRVIRRDPSPFLQSPVANNQAFRLYGPTCDSIDYMPGPFFLPEDIGEGDYIEIAQLGAYGNAMRTAFNGFDSHAVVVVTEPPMVSLYKDMKPLFPAKELCTA